MALRLFLCCSSSPGAWAAVAQWLRGELDAATPIRPSYSQTAIAANSGPLSGRPCMGIPRCANGRSNTLCRSSFAGLRRISIARHSHVHSFSIVRSLSSRPGLRRRRAIWSDVYRFPNMDAAFPVQSKHDSETGPARGWQANDSMRPSTQNAEHRPPSCRWELVSGRRGSGGPPCHDKEKARRRHDPPPSFRVSL